MMEAIDEIKAKTDNLPENLAETLGDMADKINDILDKCNDIFEKVNE